MKPLTSSRPLIRTGRGLFRISLFSSGFLAASISPCVLAGPVQLPVPCATGSCGASGPSSWVSSGQATAVYTPGNLNINQTTTQAVLNWAAFNVDAGGHVVFNQPSSSSIALNRIFQASPSAIFGSISANGQIYLINQNGILFGATSQVNVGGLLASTLGMSDSVFASGALAPILLQTKTPALQSDGRSGIIDNSGNPVYGSDGKQLPISLTVAPGAQISTNGPGQRILLASQDVENAGTITAPDGQIVLAAGQSVFLKASSDPSLRGLIVEVDQGGKAWNQLTGLLSAPRGNVSIVGLYVNQDGRVSASTTVAANGSISLVAADTPSLVADAAGAVDVTPTHGGILTLGPQSSIDVLPELQDKQTSVSAQPQVQSSINLTGDQVFLKGGAQITAPDGSLTVNAAADPFNPTFAATGADAKIRIDSGVDINLAGSVAELPMSANLVTVQLRANELADDPTQRNGALRGQTVIVDSRVGTPIANVQGAIDAIPQNIAQRTSAGGTVALISEGDVVVSPGSTINVSGGGWQFDAGSAETSKLVTASGQLVDIGAADPLVSYVGVVNPTSQQVYNRWGVTQSTTTPGSANYEAGYFKGSSAGSIQVAGRSLVIDGTLLGQVRNGAFQRTSATAAAGGELDIGVKGGLAATAGSAPDYLAPSVEFVTHPPPIVVADDASLPPQTLLLSTDYIQNGGFSRTQISSNGTVTLAAKTPLNLGVGGSLSVNAASIDLLSSIRALGGSLSLTTATTIEGIDPSAPRAGIHVGADVSLDVSGNWTNDALLAGVAADAPTSPTYYSGGSINMMLTAAGSELVLGSGDQLLANGGAWQSFSGALTPGAGGTIRIGAGGLNTAFDVGQNVAIQGFGVVGAPGGKILIEAPSLAVSGNNGTWAPAERVDSLLTPADPFVVNEGLFSQFGFSSIALVASASQSAAGGAPNLLTILKGTDINAQAPSLMLLNLSQPTGGTVSGFSEPILLPDYQRTASNVTFSAVPRPYNALTNNAGSTPGQLTEQAGSKIEVDAGGSITLESAGSIRVDGSLAAPGGRVLVHITTPDVVQDDPGYLPAQRIELGSSARIDVSGTTILTPNDSGLRLGRVMAGGTVNLLAERGSVWADDGSVIDVSGTSASLDLVLPQSTSGYSRSVIASAGGTLSLSAPESISLLGTVRAFAGSGDAQPSPAGTLSIDLSLDHFGTSSDLIGEFPVLSRVVQLSAAPPTVTSPQLGLAVISVPLITSYGIDALNVTAADQVLLDAGLNTNFARSLSLNAPAIAVNGAGTAALSSPFVTVSNSVSIGSNQAASSGSGVLSLSGGFIDLIGSTVLQNIGDARFISASDIRLRGTLTGDAVQASGSLSIVGNLTLDASRIYPVTQTNYAIEASGGSTNEVHIGQTAVSPGVPLSVNGSLTITADTIDNGGTVLAPFGQISLNGLTAVTLEPGSTTSVSGNDTTFLYGNVSALSQWQYGVGGSAPAVNAVPTRAVLLTAPSVSIAKGATVDLRGGGDLYAYQWIPGPGGSTDALAANNASGFFAVLPSLVGQAAPFDLQESGVSNFASNASIYLSGEPGLPAGVYPLLPARYALLPGAFLVKAVAGFQNLAPGQVGALADGTPIVAGRLEYTNTALGSSQFSGYAVYPGSYGGELAQYQNNIASTYFAQQAAAKGLPSPTSVADGGQLLISVNSMLDAEGAVLTAPATGGRGADIEIAASRLDVLGPGGTAADGGVSISAALLQSWQPGSLLLGGLRSADRASIDVQADSVTVGAGAHIVAGDITVVAAQAIDAQSGATLASTSGTNAQATPSAALPSDQTVLLSGAGAAGAAFLSVSDQNLAVVTRSSAAAPIATASITVESGATLQTKGAVVVDSVGDLTVKGSIDAVGARWSLAASQISFDQQSSAVSGIEVAPALLAEIQQGASLRLVTPGTINVSTDLTLGASSAAATPHFSSLTIDAASIQGSGSASALLAAGLVTLQGNAASATSPSAGTGKLTFVANEIDVGPGTLALSGFGDTTLQSSGALIGLGQGGLNTAGNLTLNVAAISAAAGSDTHLTANQGVLTIGAPTGAPPTTASVSLLGGGLTLSAQSLSDNGAIVAHGGLVTLQASQDMELGQGASIDVSGVNVVAGGRAVGAPGGVISLTSGGNLNLVSGVSLKGGGSGAESAGRLQINAGGAAAVDANLNFAADPSAQGGQFALVAGSLTNGLTDLSSRLQDGGFSLLQSVRVNSGNLTLAAGSQMTAREIDLEADAGAVLIAGTLSAPAGAQRGAINIDAANGVSIASTAQLHADAGTSGTRGGEINIGTTSGTIQLAPGSVISLVGGSQGGDLVLRAPTVGNDVAIQSLSSTFNGVGSIFIEPMVGANGGSYFAVGSAPSVSDFANIESTVSNYVTAAAPGILGRLAPSAMLPIVIRPYVDLRQSGSLEIDSSLDLSGWSQPVDLAIRSSGSLTVNAMLSDGFRTTTGFGGSHTVLLDTPSSSITLVAGADFGAASPFGIVSGSSAFGADLTIANGATVRTGTGNLNLLAAEDIIYAGPSASVYTGGLNGTPALNQSNVRFSFPTAGGNVILQAGRDVVGAPVSQSVTDWQPRQGNSKIAAAWGINFDNFFWSAGALGGGDLTVQAARDVSNLSATVADTLSLNQTTGAQQFFSSGGLRITSGHDVGSGQFFIADGLGVLAADNSFSTVRTGLDNVLLGSLIELGSAQVQINARNDITIEGVLNPTMLVQPRAPKRLISQYFTYGDNAGVALQSTAGSIAINGSELQIGQFIGLDNQTVSSNGELEVYPSSLSAHALTGDINLNANTVVLYPTSTGQLDLFAARDITSSGGSILLSDGPVSQIPTLTNLTASGLSGVYTSFAGDRHQNDSVPAFITAGRDIIDLSASLSKQVWLVAGRDIVDLTLRGQNLNPGDLTLLSAGRDFIYESTASSLSRGVSVGGPGRLDVIGGRNVDLGFSTGLVTIGALDNPQLLYPNGADLTVATGVAGNADYSGFVDKIVAPSAQYQQQLVAYVNSVTGQSNSDFSIAETAFKGFTVDQQRALVDEVFFNALLLSGRAANTTPSVGFSAGYAAIDALLPGSRTGSPTYDGTLSMPFSRIYTIQGGNISLLVPGGGVDVGLATPPSGLGVQRAPSELGIVTQGPGNINIYTQSDVLVNESRIFTLDGGNILIWSNEGSINAGLGAKSAISAPPPVVQVDSTGRVTVNFSGAVAGSGIQTIKTNPTVNPGNVDLIAPVGTVNAGDAGISAAGNINIAAQHVLGLDNIQFGGSATGVPAQVNSIGASLSSASAAATGATNAATGSVGERGDAAKETSPLAQAAISWLDVFVTGLGEDACRPDDNECLKRQKVN